VTTCADVLNPCLCQLDTVTNDADVAVTVMINLQLDGHVVEAIAAGDQAYVNRSMIKVKRESS